MKLNLLGAIGTGKTTTGKKIAEILGIEFIREDFEVNPYIEPFYKDIASGGNGSEYLYKLQTFFLAKYIKQSVEMKRTKSYVVDAGAITGLVFVKAQTALGQMTKDEHDTCVELWTACFLSMGVLDTKCRNVIIQRDLQDNLAMIKKRDREYERGMPAEFIDELKNTYDFLPSLLQDTVINFEFIDVEPGETVDKIAKRIIG